MDKYEVMAKIIDHCESQNVCCYDDLYEWCNERGLLKILLDLDFVVRSYLSSRLADQVLKGAGNDDAL